MATTIAIRFSLGRYHATPWDRSVNEGATEWPPSPWRLLRALLATWYTRWPDLPASTIDGLLEALGDPPSYRVPPTYPAHTRHYLPNLDHRSGLPDTRKQRPKFEENDPSGRELVLDPFLRLRRDAELLVRWDTDLAAEQRAALGKLVELLPYLGRADSVCEAWLLDADPVPDQTWWCPGAEGDQTTRLLSPTKPVRRSILEMSTVDVRKRRRTVPPETVWVSYGRTRPVALTSTRREVTDVQAVRFAVISRAPMKSSSGILLADAVHQQAVRRLAESGGGDLLGGSGAATDHQHAHWIPISDGAGSEACVTAVLAFAPCGLRAVDVAALLRVRKVSGHRGPADSGGYEFRGQPHVDLLLQAAGPIEQVAPELCGPARRWRSRTPYLPVRHRKRESLDEYLATDVATELRYRGRSPARVTRVDPADGLPDRSARAFRRYRMKEHMGQSRPGLGLRLEFIEEVRGPLLLGQLSHFGYGIFMPDAD